MSPLLSLPIELRREILLHLLTTTEPRPLIFCCLDHLEGFRCNTGHLIREQTRNGPHETPQNIPALGVRDLATLSRVCQQLHQDAQELLYAIPEFRFCLKRRVSSLYNMRTPQHLFSVSESMVQPSYTVSGPGVKDMSCNAGDASTLGMRSVAWNSVIERAQHVTLHVQVQTRKALRSQLVTTELELCDMKDCMDYFCDLLAQSKKLTHLQVVLVVSEESKHQILRVFPRLGMANPSHPLPLEHLGTAQQLIAMATCLEQIPDHVDVSVTLKSAGHGMRDCEFAPGTVEAKYMDDVCHKPRSELFPPRSPLFKGEFWQFRTQVLAQLTALNEQERGNHDGQLLWQARLKIKMKTVEIIAKAWECHHAGDEEGFMRAKRQLNEIWEEHWRGEVDGLGVSLALVEDKPSANIPDHIS